MNAKISMGSLTKIVNIIYLIILENFIFDGGLGFFCVPVFLYYVIYTLFFSSLQTVITRMVSVRNNKGLNGNSKRVVKPALGYVLVVGVIISLLLYLFIHTVAVKVFGTTYPIPVVMIFCVVLVFNGITDVLCGYHSGNGNDGIVRIIHVLKMVLPVLLSLILIQLFMDYGQKIEGLLKNDVVVHAYAAMGVACVYACTVILTTVVLFGLTLYTRKYTRVEKTVRGIDSRRSVMGGFTSVTLRIMLGKIFWILSLAGSVFAYLSSAKEIGFAVSDAFRNVGTMFARVLLPVLFVFILFSEYVSKEICRLRVDYNRDEVKQAVIRTQYMIKNTFFMLLPPTMIFVFLSGTVSKVFFNGNEVLASQYLKTGGFLLLLTGLAYVMGCIVSTFEKEKTVWLIQGISFIAQMVFLLIGLGNNNADSMIVLYSFYLFLCMQIVLLFVTAYTVVRMDLLDLLLKIGKYGVASIIMMVLFVILERAVSMNLLLAFLCMFLGYLLYYITLLALHALNKKDENALKRSLNYYPVHFLRTRLRL